MRKIYTLLVFMGLLGMSTQLYAQCPNDNIQFGTSTAPTVPNSTTTLTTCIYGGEYRLVTGLVAGSTYTFATCGDTDFDTQITVYNATSGAQIAYNDDGCGLQSTVTFVSTGVNVRVVVDRYFCTNQSNCMTLTATLVGSVAANPCSSIATVGCGSTTAFNLPNGTGLFTGNGPYLTPGKEVIYSFTAPYSGLFQITVSNSTGGFVDLFSRTAASGCGGTGWTYIDDIVGTTTNNVTLIGGTTYYFMLDDENTTVSTGTISFACPCPPALGPDATYLYDGPFTIAGNTIGGCNDCNIRPSEDRIYAIQIPCAGSYTFQTCGGASWDTYLYLTSAYCGGTTIASNDDGCALQSTVTANLAPGTYYINVEAFSSTGGGAFTLSVAGTATPIQMAITASSNVSCFGGSNGSATGLALSGTAPFDYEWNDPAMQTTATASGLAAGTYSVGGKDANGCVAAPATVTISEPTLLEASASSTAIACFGGTADVTVSATGGTAPYSGDGVYTVSAGTHAYTVTDANGCTSTVSITVSEPTLLEASASSTAIACFGGTSSVTVVATGGTLPYTGDVVYTVNAGTYNYSVTDANGCSANVSITVTEPTLLESSASSTAIACFGGTSDVTVVATGGTAPYSGDGVHTVTAGTHTFTVTDANGCTVDVTITITEPTLLVGSASSTVIPCFGGTSDVTVVASGGTPPYSGEGVYTVSAGTHSYTVSDANGCTAVVTIVVSQPDQIEANITPQNHVIDCIPIPVDLYANATGGTGGPYTYLWSTGATTASISVNPNVTTTYSVAITDANGCTENVTTNSTTVTVINRCGINNQKVLLCHVPAGKPNNAQTICVSPNALNPHLSSLWNLHGGDYCGPCATSNALITTGDTDLGDNTFIRAGANINTEMVEISFRLGYDSGVKVEIYDMAGVLVDVLYEGKAVEGELVEMNVQSNKMSSGVYIYQFITDHETHIDKLQIIQ